MQSGLGKVDDLSARQGERQGAVDSRLGAADSRLKRMEDKQKATKYRYRAGLWLIALVLQMLLVAAFAAQGVLKPIKGGATSRVQVGNLKLSPLGVGTWAWGNRFLWQYKEEDDVELQKTYDYVVKQGINWFDTADSYGTGSLTGQSEKLLGSFGRAYSSKRGKESSALIATKLAPFPSRIGQDSMYSAGLESISRLQQPIDIVQLHWPPFWVAPQVNDWFTKEYLTAFERLVEEKKATQVGVSNYGPRTLRQVAAVGRNLGAPVYSNQVQFSLLSRNPIQNGLDEVCAELKIQPIGYSPLALGLLADKYKFPNRLPAGPRGLLFRETLPKIEPLLAILRVVASTRGKTVAQVALNWNLQKGFLLLVGVRSVEQAKENLGALGWALSGAEVDEIDRAADRCRVSLVQNSFQTA